MAATITEKAICEKCGVEVRDGTVFCYNCGAKVLELPIAEAETSVSNGDSDALMFEAFAETEKDDSSADDGDKMSQAAEQRRRSRSGIRKTKEYAWEPTDSPGRLLLVTLLIFVIAVAVVFLTVYWK